MDGDVAWPTSSWTTSTPSISSSHHPHKADEDDLFLAISPSIVPVREPKAATTTAVSLGGLLDPPLLLREDLRDGCGGQLWPAGMVLARYLLRYRRGEMSGKSIIELGAGGGLVGLALARVCTLTEPVLITDQTPMLALMRTNIALNDLSSKARALVYDWGTPVPEACRGTFARGTRTMEMEALRKRGGYHYPDVVLAADCVYFEPAFPLLLGSLGDLLGDRTVCWFCFKRRRKADARFVKELKKKFDTEAVEYEGVEGDRREGITLLKVVTKGSTA